MTELTRISPHTTIEQDTDGTVWLVTSNAWISALWWQQVDMCESVYVLVDSGTAGIEPDWRRFTECDDEDFAIMWRVLLPTAHDVCYKYQEDRLPYLFSNNTGHSWSISEDWEFAYSYLQYRRENGNVIGHDGKPIEPMMFLDISAGILCGGLADALRTYLATVEKEMKG